MKTTILTLLLVGIASFAMAQSERDIMVYDLEIERSKGQVEVAFDVVCGRQATPRNYALTLIPVLYNGAQALALTPIVVETRRTQILDYRNRVAIAEGYVAATRGSDIAYRATFPFEAWMEGAALRIDRVQSGCGSDYMRPSLYLVDQIQLIAPTPQPHYAYIVPAVEAVKNRSESGTAYLEFAEGRSVLVAEFKDNSAELAKIRASIDLVRNDKNAVLHAIDLRGTCSPEGSWASNARLAQQRTTSVETYIEAQYGYPQNVFVVRSQPEDWQGLKTLVEQNAETPARAAILEIIDSDAEPDQKNAQIAALDNGAPYGYLLSKFYPRLRRVDYSIDYTVKGFELDESREVLRTRPQNLSLNELYLVANSYPASSSEFRNLFLLAARLFPDDPTANINAATNALERGDQSDAAFYLNRVKNSSSAEYENTKGILMMMRQKDAAAKALFEAAAQKGLESAVQNLQALNQKITFTPTFNSLF
ncbi:MAG: hypothetical protein RSB29_05010 [Alistipes sp.]